MYNVMHKVMYKVMYKLMYKVMYNVMYNVRASFKWLSLRYDTLQNFIWSKMRKI